MVIAPNLWSVHLTTSLNKQLTSTSCTYVRLKLTTILLEWFSRREESDRRNYFIINLQESIDRTGIELATPGSAVRLASVARHVTVCWLFFKVNYFKQFFQKLLQRAQRLGSTSGPTFCRFWSGFKLFAKVISRLQKSPQRVYIVSRSKHIFYRREQYIHNMACYSSLRPFLCFTTNQFAQKELLELRGY